MRKIRNAVVIIVLCIIGGYKAYKPIRLALMPPSDHIHDAVAGNGFGRTSPVNASNPNLSLSNNDGDSLHDSVAGNAIPGTGAGGSSIPHGNTNGGFGSFSGQNPNGQNPSLSPSGPVSPSTPQPPAPQPPTFKK